MSLIYQFKYIQYTYSKSLIHQFQCVVDAINDREFIFNIPFIHSSFVKSCYNFIQFSSCIYKFISNRFSFIISITSIIYFRLHYIIFVHYFFRLIIHLFQSFRINLTFTIFPILHSSNSDNFNFDIFTKH